MKKTKKEILKEKNLSEEVFEKMVNHTIDLIGDLIPYSDENYIKRVRESAENIVLDELSPGPELVRLCEEHDKLLEAGEIDF